MKLQLYVSGPLTNVPDERREELKKFYEDLAAVFETTLREAGHADAFGYVPHRYSDPIVHADLTPEQVVKLDKQRFSESSLMAMYTGLPAHGVGREHEWALAAGVPIVALYERARLEAGKVGRIARVDVTAQIVFEDYADALTQFKNWLQPGFIPGLKK